MGNKIWKDVCSDKFSLDSDARQFGDVVQGVEGLDGADINHSCQGRGGEFVNHCKYLLLGFEDSGRHFTAPNERPLTMYLWTDSVRINIGRNMNAAAAPILPQPIPVSRMKSVTATGIVMPG